MVLKIDGVVNNNEIRVLKMKGGGSGSERMLMRFFGTMGIGCMPVKYSCIGQKRRRMKLVTYRRRCKKILNKSLLYYHFRGVNNDVIVRRSFFIYNQRKS